MINKTKFIFKKINKVFIYKYLFNFIKFYNLHLKKK